MDLDRLVGGRLVVGIPGLEATAELLRTLRECHVQHLVVFARNFASPEQFTRLLRTLEDGVGWRLLVMVDHEGGRIIRFANGVTRFPDALSVGRLDDAAAVERQGATEAQELGRLGVRVNLAPCVDVLAEGADAVIGDRSYGSDPALVARLGAARIRGLQAGGVAACAKHFPGLGAVPRDPHQILPTIRLGWSEIETAHLPPFRAAIDAGAALIMSSHVCYPALGDPEGLPATFSSRLIRELLRGRLGFGGVTITDDLEMGALRAFGSVGDAAVRAAEAGHDLLLVCSGDSGVARATFDALRKAHEDGRLQRADLETSAQRIDALTRRFLPPPLAAAA